MTKRSWAIRELLVVLAISIALPLLAALAFTAYSDAQGDSVQAGESALNLAQLAAVYTGQVIAATKGLLEGLSQRPLVRAANPLQCDPLLADLHALTSQYANVTVGSRDGFNVCSAASPIFSQPVNVSDTKVFQDLVRTNEFVVGAPLISRVVGHWTSPLLYPIRDDQGNFNGWVGLPIDLVSLSASLKSVALPAGGVIGIVDSNGTVVAGTPDFEKWVGQNMRGKGVVQAVLSRDEGSAQVRGIDDVERLFGFTTVPNTDWHVFAGIPTDVALAGAHQAIVRNLLIGVLSLASALGLTLLVARVIESPIGALAAATRGIAEGHMGTRAPERGPREIAETAARFNAMVDARAQANAALVESENRYRTLMQQASDAIFITDPPGNYMMVNLKACEMLGYSEAELLKMNLRDVVAPKDVPDVLRGVGEVLQGKLIVQERELVRKNGTCLPTDVSAKMLPDGRLQAIVRDITERKLAEEALRQARERAESILASISDTYSVLDRQWRYLYVNRAAADAIAAANPVGIPSEEIMEHTLWELFPDIIGTDLEHQYRRAMEQRTTTIFEYHYLTRDTWWENRFYPAPDGLAVFGSDISERKRAVAALESVSRRLLEAQENERREVARELHDEIGQVLTAVKTNLETIRLVPNPSSLNQRLGESIEIVNRALNQVRTLSLDLRPSLLDDFGLYPTLKWLIDRTQKRSGMEIEFRTNLTDRRFASSVETVCFRVAQAALTNIERHAKAKHVYVELHENFIGMSETEVRTELHLEIRDDGVGFNVPDALARAEQGATLGLVGMKERARLAGGEMDIQSAPLCGTEIHARFPLGAS